MFFSRCREKAAQKAREIEFLDALERAIEAENALGIVRWLELHQNEPFKFDYLRKSELFASGASLLWLQSRDELWRLLEIKALYPHEIRPTLENLAGEMPVADLVSLIERGILPTIWAQKLSARLVWEASETVSRALISQLQNPENPSQFAWILAQRDDSIARQWLADGAEKWDVSPHWKGSFELLNGLVKRHDEFGRALLERFWEQNLQLRPCRRAIAAAFLNYEPQRVLLATLDDLKSAPDDKTRVEILNWLEQHARAFAEKTDLNAEITLEKVATVDWKNWSSATRAALLIVWNSHFRNWPRPKNAGWRAKSVAWLVAAFKIVRFRKIGFFAPMILTWILGIFYLRTLAYALNLPSVENELLPRVTIGVAAFVAGITEGSDADFFITPIEKWRRSQMFWFAFAAFWLVPLAASFWF